MEMAINQELGKKMWNETGARKLQQDGCFLIQKRPTGFDLEVVATVCSGMALLISYAFSHTRLYNCTWTSIYPSFLSRTEGFYLLFVPRKGTPAHCPEWPSERMGSQCTICPSSGFFQFTWNDAALTASYRMWRWSCFPLAWLEVKKLFSSFLANAASFSEIFHADNG